MTQEERAKAQRAEAEFGEIEADQIPRCEELDGSTLRILPAYTEAGQFCEARCIMVTDGERTAVYVPLKVAAPRSR